MTLDNETLKIAGDLAYRVWEKYWSDFAHPGNREAAFDDIYRRILNVIIDVQRPSVIIERIADAHKIREQGLENEALADEIPWHDAPDWAQWAAMDEDGRFCWFEKKPSPLAGEGIWILSDGNADWIGTNFPAGQVNWMESLVERPVDK